MIEANTGSSIPRPPGDLWPDASVAFGVVWHTDYVEFPDCNSTTQVDRNDPPPTQYPPPTQPVPPDPGSCAYAGGGGNYHSNESAYRNALLRDRLTAHVAAGHIHTPYMQNFAPGDLYNPSDSTFAAWRSAIVPGEGARPCSRRQCTVTCHPNRPCVPGEISAHGRRWSGARGCCSEDVVDAFGGDRPPGDREVALVM